jgi:hypothetical protein
MQQALVGRRKPREILRMTRNSGGRNMASAVRETLDSIVSPSVRDTILARALGEAKKKELPAELVEFDSFVRGPLHDELVRALGPELGTSVAQELERISALANRDAKLRDKGQRSEARPETVRPGRKHAAEPPAVTQREKRRTSPTTMPSPQSPASEGSRHPAWIEQQRAAAPTIPASAQGAEAGRSAPTQPARGAVSAQPVSDDFPAGTAKALGVIGTASIGPGSVAQPIVYIASTNSELVRTFEKWLSGRALVRTVAGAGPLLQALLEPSEKRSVVVLDGKSPTIRPLTLAALAEELPANTSVLLWGVPPHVHARMCSVSAATEKWLVAGGSCDPTEIVNRCVKLVC